MHLIASTSLVEKMVPIAAAKDHAKSRYSHLYQCSNPSGAPAILVPHIYFAKYTTELNLANKFTAKAISGLVLFARYINALMILSMVLQD
ncbi:hypothetical protein V6Z12_D06G055600 [Gossypium hirsutum]